VAGNPSSDERRFGPRRATNVKVFTHDGIELRRCRLRDISLRGAYIESKNCPLAAGQNVELVIRVRRDGQLTHCRFPARVLRTEPDGAALVFAELDPHLQAVLVDLVFGNESDQGSKASY
jgi:hypothetical protein